MNLKNRLKQQQKAKQHMEKANVQKMQIANDENQTLSNNGDGESRPEPTVLGVESSQGGEEQLNSEQQRSCEDLLRKLNEVADKMKDFIPNDDNYIVDLSRESIRNALAGAIVPIAIQQLHELLKDRQKEQIDARKRQRVEVEREGKTIILEEEELAYVIDRYYDVLGYHNTLRKGIDAWDAQRKAYVQGHKKDRAHMLSEFRNAVTFMKRFKTECNAEIKNYLDIAIANKKANLKPAPKKPEGNNLWFLLRYWLFSVPLYKVYCFLTDRYTLGLFHTAILSVIVILVSTICFMASNEAKLEQESEKYQIARSWSYVNDDYDAKTRFRILDALFEDEKTNRLEINGLKRQIRVEHDKQLEQKHAVEKKK